MGADRGDRLKQLRAFCHTARIGSISKAAEHLFLSQPSVSLHIRSLEKEFGVALFERKHRRIVPTAAGRTLYRRALPLVEGLDRLPDTFDEHYRHLVGRLSIGASATAASYLLPRHLKALTARHANMEVRARVGDSIECFKWLRDFEVDIVFTAMDVEAPDFEFHVLVVSPYVLITPESHPLANLPRAGPHDVGDHPQIAHTRQRAIEAFGGMHLRQHCVAANIVVDVDGWETIKDYVEAGLGVAIVPSLCLTERDRVRRVPYEAALPARHYGYVTRREGVVPLAVQRFMKVLEAASDRDRQLPGNTRTPH